MIYEIQSHGIHNKIMDFAAYKIYTIFMALVGRCLLVYYSYPTMICDYHKMKLKIDNVKDIDHVKKVAEYKEVFYNNFQLFQERIYMYVLATVA